MGRKKLLSVFLLLVIGLVACSSNSGEGDANDATEAGDGKVFKLAHNLSEEHVVHKAIKNFSDKIEEETDGEIEIDIYPNGELGEEEEEVQQVKNGSIEMTKVSAGTLESFNDKYRVFSLPYIFEGMDHYRDFMESDSIDEIYESTEDDGFIGISYIDSGTRSFYTTDEPIEKPEDLNGKKIRTMDSPTATKMVEEMGGSATPMGYDEIYTSLQEGVIDGAENNPTALTDGKHGEVVDHFVYDEHTIIPDILIINKDEWDDLTEEQQEIFKEVSDENREESSKLWEEEIDDAVSEAKEMGVEFHDVDKE